MGDAASLRSKQQSQGYSAGATVIGIGQAVGVSQFVQARLSHLARVDDDASTTDIHTLNNGRCLCSQRRNDARDMKHCRGAFECGFDVRRVADVAANVRHTGMFDDWQQHIEHDDSILLRLLQQQFDDSSTHESASTGDHHNRSCANMRGCKKFKLDL